MSIKGKLNTFFKGMKSDMEESIQPKESYRYARNARVTSHDGDNVSIQPFPSDKLALTFRGEASYASGIPSLSYTGNWTPGLEVNTINDVLQLAGYEWPSNLSFFEQAWGPVPIQSTFSQFNIGAGQVLLTITLQTINGNEYIINENIATAYGLTVYNNIPFDVDAVTAFIINQSSNGISATVTTNPPEGNYYGNVGIGTLGSTANWVFVNTGDLSDYVSSFSVSVQGVGQYTIQNQEFLQNILIGSLEQDAGQQVGEDWGGLGVTIMNGILQVIFDAITDYYNNLPPVEINTILINNQELSPGGLSIFEQVAESLGFSIDEPGIQVLGTYSFSDHLVLLGKWPLIGALQEANGNQVACDVIIKVNQAPDGTLNGNGLGGFGDFIPFDELGSLYTIYYVGNLEFSLKRKIKVTGSEETKNTRRIYFTDGEFPLKTMNIGLDPYIYSPYQNIPGYFNLFSPAVFSPTVVTGFLDGGNLDSISYSYGYKYKTVDGRYSQLSPLSNPASLPHTGKSVMSSYTKGAASGEISGKSITGEIKSLDTRYSKVQLIYVPYMNNSPAGPGIAFAEYPIPPENNNGENTVFWKHTGTEIAIDEFTIADLNENQITWDVCKAMETKDNRLFVGNLSNSIETIGSDFRVASYNSQNQNHSYTGNPHLYNDLLYSSGGLSFQNGNPELTLATPDGVYAKPYDNDLYRYIKGPSDTVGPFSALYEGEVLGLSFQRRGIFGAQSKGFDTLNDNEEYEGIRVTFRMLDKDKSIELDSNARLIDGEGYKAQAPYYNVSSGESSFYNTYANPIYNSNYVGYRRGEIYRFGLLFYDKQGSPMFVKQIGDIRMPEHSAEYITPVYDSINENNPITGFEHKWPYYYQTTRDPKDHGFEEPDSYENESTSKGCVLYPYFEVKLSSETTSKIGGYAVVRVARDSINRTIVTSGILSRAIKYHPNASNPKLKDKFANGTFPFWTELRQSAKDSSTVHRFGGKEKKASRVYTLDSPDVCMDGDFIYNHSSTDRIKLTESGFCQKQNVSYGTDDGTYVFLNKELSDRLYVDFGGGGEENGYIIQPNSYNMFSSVISKSTLTGETITINEEDYDTGGWMYEFSDDAQSEIEGEEKELGYFTKYYTKRVSCYPQYGLVNAKHGDGDIALGTNIEFNIGEQQKTSKLPFNLLSSTAPFWINKPNEPSSDYKPDTFFETNIYHGQILNPDDEMSSSNIPEDSRDYKNAHFFHELFGQTASDFNQSQKKSSTEVSGTVFNKASYAQNIKTIGLVLSEPGMLPTIRQNLYKNNYHEGIVRKIGRGGGALGGNYSPEVTIASIYRKQGPDTMYGGNTEGDFSRNIFQSTGHFKSVKNSLSQDFEGPQIDVGNNGNNIFGGDTYVGYHKYKKTFRSETDADNAVCFASIVPLECEFNLDLRHGLNFSNNSDSIFRYIPDDFLYNETFDSENNGLIFNPRPIDFREVNHWPAIIAWSEQKIPGETDDNYSIFPVNQVKDLDYTKGPITQMFLLKNEIYTLQHSGTCKLSINPRILIPSKDGTAIQATTGSGEIVERYDYISDRFGCQHFHGLAVSDAGAYYYDDNHCKFLRLGKTGKKGTLGVVSLGDSASMQSYFNEYKNLVINDSPLTNLVYGNEFLPPSTFYDLSVNDKYELTAEEGFGGVSIGHDPEYSEILLTIMAENKVPKTIVYNENLQAFTSFISKIPANYFNFNGRLYCVYNKHGNGLDEIYLSNGFEGDDFWDLTISPARYLNFGDIDYYIWDTNPIDIEGNLIAAPIEKEPFEMELVINDNPVQSKIFDKIQLSVNPDTEEGYRYIYFRKFAFKGSANPRPVVEFDKNILGINYSSLDNLEGGVVRNWYSVKDASHFIPMRQIDGINGPDGKVRGNYATIRLTMGWAEDNNHPIGYDRIKNEKFNIFSAVPFFRASRI